VRDIVKTNILLVCIVFAILGCESDNTVQGHQPVNSLHFSPDVVTLSPNDSARVSLVISGLSTNIFGMSFQIVCDSTVISFISEPEAGDFFGQEEISFSRTTESTIHMSITNIQGNAPVNGSGTICTLYFSGQSEGDCLIHLLRDELRLYNSAGIEIENLDLELSSAIIQIR